MVIAIVLYTMKVSKVHKSLALLNFATRDREAIHSKQELVIIIADLVSSLLSLVKVASYNHIIAEAKKSILESIFKMKTNHALTNGESVINRKGTAILVNIKYDHRKKVDQQTKMGMLIVTLVYW